MLDRMRVVQLEAADQTTLTSLLAHDDGLPLDELSLPDHPVSLPLDSVSRRQMAHAYRLIRHKYSKGRRSNSAPAIHASKPLQYITSGLAQLCRGAGPHMYGAYSLSSGDCIG